MTVSGRGSRILLAVLLLAVVYVLERWSTFRDYDVGLVYHPETGQVYTFKMFTVVHPVAMGLWTADYFVPFRTPPRLYVDDVTYHGTLDTLGSVNRALSDSALRGLTPDEVMARFDSVSSATLARLYSGLAADSVSLPNSRGTITHHLIHLQWVGRLNIEVDALIPEAWRAHLERYGRAEVADVTVIEQRRVFHLDDHSQESDETVYHTLRGAVVLHGFAAGMVASEELGIEF